MVVRLSDDAVYRFDDFEIVVRRIEVRHCGNPVPVEPMVFDVLTYLLEHRDRVVSKGELLDNVWGTRFVSESALTSSIKAVRQLLYDDGKTQRLVRTVYGRGYQFVGNVETTLDSVPAPITPALSIRFAKGRGDVQLAIGETGDGVPMIKTANWLTHVDKDTDSPIWGHWVRDLSRAHRLIRYDARGCGLSDRDLRGIALDDLDLWVEDLERIVDTLAIERFALLGISQGGPVAVAYAVRHPERVCALILYGAYARGMARRDAAQADEAAVQVDLARVAWGTANESFRQVFASQFVPGAGTEERKWLTELLRTTTNAENAPQLEAAFHHLDITSLAEQTSVPTLVMHALKDEAVPFEEGRRLAGLIPHARFVALDCANHVILERDPAWPVFVRELEGFISSCVNGETAQART